MKKLIFIFLSVSSLSFSLMMNIADYRVIGNSVYDYDKKIEKADIETFTIIGSCCAKDKNNVYFSDKIVNGVDSATFTAISGKNGSLYYKDKNNIYFAEVNDLITVKGADLATFTVYDQITAGDKNNKYFRAEKLTNKKSLNEWNERVEVIKSGGILIM